jgi:hypothetical protein
MQQQGDTAQEPDCSSPVLHCSAENWPRPVHGQSGPPGLVAAACYSSMHTAQQPGRSSPVLHCRAENCPGPVHGHCGPITHNTQHTLGPGSTLLCTGCHIPECTIQKESQAAAHLCCTAELRTAQGLCMATAVLQGCCSWSAAWTGCPHMLLDWGTCVGERGQKQQKQQQQ